MDALKQKTKTVAAKLGDHPNVSEDPSVNPESGIGIDANDGHRESRSAVVARNGADSLADAGKSDVQNRIEAGQGGIEAKDKIQAGTTTSADTVSAASKGGDIERQ